MQLFYSLEGHMTLVSILFEQTDRTAALIFVTDQGGGLGRPVPVLGPVVEDPCSKWRSTSDGVMASLARLSLRYAERAGSV